MLPKKERINSEMFAFIMQNGKTIRTNVLYAKYVENTGKRFAVSVPKKIVKSAVQRHLIKRRIMSSIRENRESFINGDYIIFVTKQMLGSSGAVLDTIIEDLAEKVAS